MGYKYILAIDQGTTGTKVTLVNADSFEFIDSHGQEFSQIFPKPGWVEHDLNDIWSTVQNTIKVVLDKNKINAKDILAIGITNQRETICAFDKGGTPLANAIVWQDRRTAQFCLSLKEKICETKIKEITGLPIDPYFSGSKINWLLNNNEKVKKAAQSSNLKFGTIDTFLIYKLTGGSAFVTEASNASRTLLMDLKTCDWSDELLKLFNIEKSFLPIIKNSFGKFGTTSGLNFLPEGIPITGVLGDQQAALFGQNGVKEGGIKVTYGTGSFILLNTGENIIQSSSGLLSTIAYKDAHKTVYALEGSCYIAGAAVQWLRDKLEVIDSSPEIESLANSITNLDEMEHILFLPFFTGIGSPYWISEAKAAIVGLTRDTNKAHIARACLEGIALSINDLITAMKKDSGLNITELKVDGGATSNKLLMKIQATISQIKIIRPKITETTSYGAALAAGIGAKLLNYSDISKYWNNDSIFEQDNSQLNYFKHKISQWDNTIQKLYR